MNNDFSVKNQNVTQISKIPISQIVYQLKKKDS